MTRRAALVSGASRGLGAVISRRLAAAGWAVAVSYRSDDAAASAVVADIRAAGGVAEAIPGDVTDEAAVATLTARVVDQLGPVGLVVANATGPQPTSALESMTWRAHLDQLEFFVKSPTLLVQAALPVDAESRWRAGGPDRERHGRSGAARVVGVRRRQDGQIGLTRVWAKELGPDRITVNLVAPRWIPVERHAGADTANYQADVPLGEMGTPDDIASMVAYLASDERTSSPASASRSTAATPSEVGSASQSAVERADERPDQDQHAAADEQDPWVEAGQQAHERGTDGRGDDLEGRNGDEHLARASGGACSDRAPRLPVRYGACMRADQEEPAPARRGASRPRRTRRR